MSITLLYLIPNVIQVIVSNSLNCVAHIVILDFPLLFYQVSKRVFSLSPEDILMMTEETTCKLFGANFQLGDLKYFIQNHSLQLVGVECRVQAGIDIFLKQFY